MIVRLVVAVLLTALAACAQVRGDNTAMMDTPESSSGSSGSMDSY